MDDNYNNTALLLLPGTKEVRQFPHKNNGVLQLIIIIDIM